MAKPRKIALDTLTARAKLEPAQGILFRQDRATHRARLSPQ